MADHFGTISMKWNPKNLEIRTMSVEKTLEPLVLQVTTLVNTKGPSKKKKGRSKRAHVLVAAIEKATENFIEKGELIVYENPDIKREMLDAVEEVRKTGDAMSFAAREFADDPCSSLKRGNMVHNRANNSRTSNDNYNASFSGLSESVNNLSLSSNGVRNNSSNSFNNRRSQSSSYTPNNYSAMSRLNRLRPTGSNGSNTSNSAAENGAKFTLNPDAKEFVPSSPRAAALSNSEDEKVSS